jgi:hypothetical protein
MSILPPAATSTEIEIGFENSKSKLFIMPDILRLLLWHYDPSIILYVKNHINILLHPEIDRLCGLMARVPGYRSRDPGSIPGATRFSEK